MTVRNLEARTPLVGEILISGFEAILAAINENAERGDSTHIMPMAAKLRERIIKSCGYDYPLTELAKALELWLLSYGKKVQL